MELKWPLLRLVSVSTPGEAVVIVAPLTTSASGTTKVFVPPLTCAVITTLDPSTERPGMSVVVDPVASIATFQPRSGLAVVAISISILPVDT
jgi:hypothetical protein